MKRAFTLVELMIVIGILAILMSVLIVSMGNGTETARSAKCLTNMKNLASACQNYGMSTGYYPLAGSVEQLKFNESRGIGKQSNKEFHEIVGWLSWYSQGTYKEGSYPTGHSSSAGWFSSAYCQDDEERTYCVTNGALWRYLTGNKDIFICPEHKRDVKLQPYFSYVMNEYFKWDNSEGSKYKPEEFYAREYGHIAKADRKLLFAELQWKDGYAGTPTISSAAGTTCDCTLQYTKNEVIGFNHRAGREKVAHIVFADGHVDKLRLPKGGMSDSELRELTKWLCNGVDFSFNGQRYEEIR